MEKKKQVFRCPVCSTERIKLFYTLERLKREVYRCSSCNFTWVEPPLLYCEGINLDHYKTPYYSEHLNPYDATKAKVHFENIKKIVDLSTLPSKEVLEIGCSYGHLLQYFVAMGYNVEGIELLEDAVNFCVKRGLTVYDVPIEDFNTQKKYGAVLSVHVVEHLQDIDAYFYKTSHILVPGGLNIIITPNGNSFFFKFLRRYWTYATPDEHNLFLTPEAIQVLARRHNLEIMTIKNTGRKCSLLRGILREVYKSYKFRSQSTIENIKNGKETPIIPGHNKKSRKDIIYKVISLIESPFLNTIHKVLLPFNYSDELLAVLKKPFHD